MEAKLQEKAAQEGYEMDEEQPQQPQPTLDYFGRLLVENVRDVAIVYADKLVDGEMKSEASQRVAKLFSSFDAEQRDTVHRLIPDIVDNVLRLLMNVLDADPNIDVSVLSNGEERVNLREASEDLNWEMPGWIAEYSKQRSNTFANFVDFKDR